MYTILAAVATVLFAAVAIAWVLVVRRRRRRDSYPARHRSATGRRAAGQPTGTAPLASPTQPDRDAPAYAVGRASVGVDHQMFPVVFRPWPSGMRLLHMRMHGVTK